MSASTETQGRQAAALRSGSAYWPQINGPLAEYPPLTENTSCDVAIIGGGITGALVAFMLADQGVDTLLVDKGKVAAGSTAASTALLQHEVDRHLCELTEMIGADGAIRVYRLGLEAIRVIQDLLGRVDDPCGFEAKNSLYLASEDADAPILHKEFHARRQAGFDVDFFTAEDVRGQCSFASPAAILSRGNGQIDSYRLTHRLLQWAARHQVRVHEHTELVCWEARDRGIRLNTAERCHIDARKVVFATGYETERYLHHKVGDLNSTFALVSEPLASFDGWPDRCQIWESARPYFYLRVTPDGRAIVGGEDDPHPAAHSDMELLARKTDKLVRRFHDMFPAIELKVASAWSGTFGESHDGLPMIGSTDAFSHAYFALGYGGNGITHSVIAAQIIADMHLGKRNRDAELFRLDR